MYSSLLFAAAWSLAALRPAAAQGAAASTIVQQQPAAAATSIVQQQQQQQPPAAATTILQQAQPTLLQPAQPSTVEQGPAGTPGAAATGSSSTDPCAQAAASQLASLKANPPKRPGDLIFAAIDAATAYQCAQSVPFVAEHATQLVEMAKEYVQFQTTLTTLKNPPPSYQQPPIDVVGTLDQIAANIKAGHYQNQYAFDQDIFKLVGATHEGHFNLDIGVIGLFFWTLPDSIVSVSSDGKALPEVYAYSDVMANDANASPIVSINNESTFKWLQDYAANNTQIGDIDPMGDWNVLMTDSASQFAQGASSQVSFLPSQFQLTKVYTGPSLNGTFKNGTNFSWPYTAGAARVLATSRMTSGNNIYQNFVMNPKMTTAPIADVLAPQTSLPQQAQPSAAPEPTFTAVPGFNYPQDPIVVQANFGTEGTVSGYILKDISVGVLSMPSFASNGEGGGPSTAFSAAVAKFIKEAKAANVQKVIIDVSGNGGGTILQGYDTFKQFFPTTESYLGYRTRATPNMNTIGTILTDLTLQPNKEIQASTESELVNFTGPISVFNAAFTLKEDGSDWKNWQDFFGPRNINGDNFTNTMQLNLSSPIGTAIGFGEFVAGFGNNQLSYAQPWKAEDVILLTDAQCASTCTIFAELMKTNAGVKTVVVGGVPEYGPMQGVTGTRGGNVQAWTLITTMRDTLEQHINSDVLNSLQLNEKDLNNLPIPIEQAFYNIRQARFNILDKIRPDSPDTALQFAYEAADCRLFYTAPMVRDITQLWRAAAKVVGGDYSGCVPGSTNGIGAAPNTTVTTDTGFSEEKTWNNANSTSIPSGASPSPSSSSGSSPPGAVAAAKNAAATSSTAHLVQSLLGVALAVFISL